MAVRQRQTWMEWFAWALGRYSTPTHYLFDIYTYYLPVFCALKEIAPPYLPVFCAPDNILPPPARLLDLGCGLRSRNFCLQSWGYDCHGIDIDPDVLRLGDSMPCGSQTWAVYGDFWSPPTGYDISTSWGVIEHNPPDKQIEMLRVQGTTARTHLAAIPSGMYLDIDPPDFAEERISLAQLVQRAQAAGWTIRAAGGWGDPPQEAALKDSTLPATWRAWQAAGEHCLSLYVIGQTPDRAPREPGTA